MTFSGFILLILIGCDSMCEYNPNSYIGKLKELNERITIKEKECQDLREQFIAVSETANT